MEKRQYIKLTSLSGSLIPAEENLTPEEKHEREGRRIISGDDDVDNGITIFEYGNFKKFPMYLPIDLIDTIYGTPQGTVIETESGNYLVEEEVSIVMDKLIGVGYAEVV